MQLTRYSSEINQKIWSLAWDHLRGFNGVDDSIIYKHLDNYKNRKPKSISGRDSIFFEMVGSLTEQRQVPYTIGDISRFDKILFGFDPVTVANSYSDWEQLFDAFQNGLASPKGRFNKESPRDTWVKYSKGVLDIARFLSRFRSIKEYEKFLKGFRTNEFSKLALPLLLDKEITFMGFALACNFLKETTGHGEYVKPDIHIIDLFYGIGLSSTRDPYRVFKDVLLYSKSINQVPYCVDKVFWLIGSCKFYLSWKGKDQYRNHKLCTDSKKFFIKMVKDKLSI